MTRPSEWWKIARDLKFAQDAYWDNAKNDVWELVQKAVDGKFIGNSRLVFLELLSVGSILSGGEGVGLLIQRLIQENGQRARIKVIGDLVDAELKSWKVAREKLSEFGDDARSGLLSQDDDQLMLRFSNLWLALNRGKGQSREILSLLEECPIGGNR